MTRWSQPNGLGERAATVDGKTYRLERSFYKSRGQWRRRYRVVRPDGTIVSGVNDYRDAVTWLRKQQEVKR